MLIKMAKPITMPIPNATTTKTKRKAGIGSPTITLMEIATLLLGGAGAKVRTQDVTYPCLIFHIVDSRRPNHRRWHELTNLNGNYNHRFLHNQEICFSGLIKDIEYIK